MRIGGGCLNDLYTTYVLHLLPPLPKDSDGNFTVSPPALMFRQPGLPERMARWKIHHGYAYGDAWDIVCPTIMIHLSFNYHVLGWFHKKYVGHACHLYLLKEILKGYVSYQVIPPRCSCRYLSTTLPTLRVHQVLLIGKESP